MAEGKTEEVARRSRRSLSRSGRGVSPTLAACQQVPTLVSLLPLGGAVWGATTTVYRPAVVSRPLDVVSMSLRERKTKKTKAQVDYTYTGHARRGRLGWAGWGKKTEVDRVALNHCGYARIR